MTRCGKKPSMLSYEQINEIAFAMSGLDRRDWECVDDQTRLYWRLRAAKENVKRFALVRMELIGEPTTTPDGQSIQLARFPWQRPDDASHGIRLNDIVEIENGTRRLDCCSMPKTEAL